MVGPLGIAKIGKHAPAELVLPGAGVESCQTIDRVPGAAGTLRLHLVGSEGAQVPAVPADELRDQLLPDDRLDHLFQPGTEPGGIRIQEKLLVGQDLVGKALACHLVEHVQASRNVRQRGGDALEVELEGGREVLPLGAGFLPGITGEGFLQGLGGQLLHR